MHSCYFILFDAIVLILSLPVFYLCIETQKIFVYWFCISQVYQIHLLARTVSLVKSLEFSIIISCHLQIVTMFLLPLQLDVPPFLPCLIAPVKASNTMLNKSGGSGHHCFFPDIGRKAFRFSPLGMMLSVALLHCWSVLCWSMFPLYSLAENFYHK